MTKTNIFNKILIIQKKNEKIAIKTLQMTLINIEYIKNTLNIKEMLSNIKSLISSKNNISPLFLLISILINN